MLRQYAVERVAPFLKVMLPFMVLWSLGMSYHGYQSEQDRAEKMEKAVGVITQVETRTFPNQTNPHTFANIRYCVGLTCIESQFSELAPTKHVRDTVTVYCAKDNPYAAQLTGGTSLSALITQLLLAGLPFALWLWVMRNY